MSIYLINRQWGYQTICPDEENVTGLYKSENPLTIKFYNNPSFSSDIVYYPFNDFIWGWKEKQDHKNKITWIKVSEDSSIWAPIDKYEGRIITCSLCKEEGHNKRTCKNKPT